MILRAIQTSAVLCLTTFLAAAQSVPDYAVRVSAVGHTDPPQITLSWPPDTRATNYTLYRKSRDATSWGSATRLANTATNYTDSNVAIGSAYEYRIAKSGWTGTTNYTGEGYIYAGIEVPLTESRGKVILLVDNSVAAALASELSRLQLDLVGDGWRVLRHDVARDDAVPNIKNVIKSDYNTDPANVKAVFLFGHVPVPYSGDLYPDGHTNHWGAWPADVYYGEMNSTWTDSAVNDTSAADARNRNVPGDGKFDQSLIPSTVELQVGRVDLANLPAFPLSEVELLRQYLNKNHNFRHAFLRAERRGLIDDHFGVFSGEAFAVSGWRNFAPFFTAANTFAGDWLTTLDSSSYLWGFGCGSGTYTGAGGVASTSDLAKSDPRVVFTMLFGSYFGDWDSPNNFLRAQLATPTWTLAAAWAGRPHWMFHHLALGETIGFSTRVTQNNSSTYAANLALHWVHIALMGDSTLRLHPVAPPSALTIVTNGAGGVRLSWHASVDNVAGYHVYRATTTAGPFTRLTSSLLKTTNYTDTVVSSNGYTVRAVKLEESASGSYYNASQGVFQSLDPKFAIPSIVLSRPTNNASWYELADVLLVVSTFDPAASIERVEFYADAVKLGESATPPFTFIWSNAPAADYTLTARAIFNGGQFTNSNAVIVHLTEVPPPTLEIADLGNGTMEIRGQGIAGLTYQFQSTADLTDPDWQSAATVTANASGVFGLTNTASAAPRFYRAVYP